MIVEDNFEKGKKNFRQPLREQALDPWEPRFEIDYRLKRTAPPMHPERTLQTALLILKNVCFENDLLVFGNYRILQSFADAEFERGLGRNLYGLTRRRVTAFARFSLGQDEFAETWQNELSV